jgi:DnaJ-class molecular chaperone
MSGHLIIALAVLAAGWVVRAYFWPYAACSRCSGRKVSKGSTRKRFGLCGKCGGTGARQVLGSKAVHRAVRSARSAWTGRKEKK